MTDQAGPAAQIAPTGATTGRRSTWQTILVWCAALAVAGLYVADAAAHGALGAARNDDWVYYRMAFDFAETGKLSFDPYTSTMLVGQVVAAKPVIWLFGPSIAALQLCVAAISAVSIALIYFFIRRFLPALWAGFSVACLAVGPIWGGVSVTFLSDAPSLALQVVCMFLALPALSGPKIRWPLLLASLTIGFVAFSVREYAITAVGSVLLVALMRHRKAGRDLALVLGLGVGWLFSAVALFAWRSSLVQGNRALRPRLELDERVWSLSLGLLTTAGFMLFPVVFALGPMSLGRTLRRYWPVTFLFIALFVYTSRVLGFPLLTGNYIRVGGSYSGTMSGAAPRVFSEETWWVIMALAIVSTSLLLTFAIALIVRRTTSYRRRSLATDTLVKSPEKTAFMLAAAFGLIGFFLTIVVTVVSGGRPFDRYIVGIVPFLVAAAIYVARDKAGNRASQFAGAAGLVMLALIGVVQVDASATFDGTKWSLGKEAAGLGYASSTVDAGYEWYGFHQPSPVVFQSSRDQEFPFWVTRLFVDGRVCVSGRVAPRPVTKAPYAGELLRVSRTTLTGLEYVMIGTVADRGCNRP